MQVIKLTNQEETPLSYRKAQIISNHLGRLNILLTSTVRATFRLAHYRAHKRRQN